MTSGWPAGGPWPDRPIGQPLDRFAASAAAAEGLRLADLAPSDGLEVRTRNTRYLISTIALRDSRVVVTGGRFFPLPREAQLVGATLGGSAVKLGWIGRGSVWNSSGTVRGSSPRASASSGSSPAQARATDANRQKPR